MSSLLMGEKKPKLEKVQRRRCLLQELEEGAVCRSKPFSGKSFYLDLPSSKKAKFLADAVRHLGGTIESFLSKEVSYVVSSSKDMRPNCKALKPATGKVSEATNETGIGSSIIAEKENAAGSINKLAQNVQITRGKELLEKVMKNNERSNNSILANACSWGVRILCIDDVLVYVEKMMQMNSVKEKEECSKKTFQGKSRTSVLGSRTLKVGKLKHPFIKVEDTSRNFRPVYTHFSNFPYLNLFSPGSMGPFDPPEPLPCSQKEQRPARQLKENETTSEREEKSVKPALTGQKKKREGFCECCRLSFTELQTHLQTDEHRKYAVDSSHYSPVDGIITQFTTDFTDLQTEPQSPRSVCRIASSHSAHTDCIAESDVSNCPDPEEQNCSFKENLEPLKAVNPEKCIQPEGCVAQAECSWPELPPVLQRMDTVLDCSDQLASVFEDGASIYTEPPVLSREDFCYKDPFIKDDYVKSECMTLGNFCDSGKELLPPNMYSTGKDVFQSDITAVFLPDEDSKQEQEISNVEVGNSNTTLCTTRKRPRSTSESQLCIKRSRLASCSRGPDEAGHADSSPLGQLESHNSCSKADINICSSTVLLADDLKGKALCSFEERLCTSESKVELSSPSCISREVPGVCKQEQEEFGTDKCELNKMLYCAQESFTETEVHFSGADHAADGEVSAVTKVRAISPVASNLEQWSLQAKMASPDGKAKLETFMPINTTVLPVSDKWIIPMGETLFLPEKCEFGEVLAQSCVPSVVNSDQYALHTFTFPHTEEFKCVEQQSDCTSLVNSLGNKLSTGDSDKVPEKLPQRRLSPMHYADGLSNIRNRENVQNSSFICKSSFLHSTFKIDASLLKSGNFSSDSEWDIPLLSQVDTDLQTPREQSVDMEALARSCAAVQESGYESRLFSVLKQKPRLDQLGKDEKSHGNCRSEILPFMLEQCVEWAN